jgi:hypothetical protein
MAPVLWEDDARWRRALPVAVGLVFVVGLALRVVHLDFGLPGEYHANEIGATQQIQGWLTGSHSLGHYNHPPLLKNIAYLLVRARDAVSHSPPSSETVILALRIVSAAAGAVTVVVVYRLARHFLGQPLALLAAALDAVLPLTVFHSMYGAPDALESLFFALGLLGALNLYERPSRPAYLLAGLWLSLAIGAKYPGGLVLVADVLAHVLAARRARAAGEALPRRRFALFAAGVVVGLAVSFPLVPFELPVIARDFQAEVRHVLVVGHPDVKVSGRDYALLYHFGHSVLPAAGPLLLAAMIAGLVLMALRRRPKELILLAGLVPYYVIIEWAFLVPPVPERYVLPLVGPYLVAAAVALDALCGHLRTRERWIPAAAAGAVLLLAWPAVRTCTLLGGVEPDTRARMRAWMADHLPEGSSVAIEGRPAYYPLEPPGLHYVPSRFDPNGGPRAIRGYVLFNSLAADRYLDHPEQAPRETAYLQAVFANGALLYEAADPSHRYLVHNPTLRLYALP